MLHATGLCVGNSPGTGEFPTQMASYAENVSIWWRHHATENSWVCMDSNHKPAIYLKKSEEVESFNI